MVAGLALAACSSDRGQNSESVQAKSSPASSNSLRTAPNVGEQTIAEIQTEATDIYEASKASD